MVIESIFAFVSILQVLPATLQSGANLDLTHFYALQGTGEANMLRPVQALCSRKSLVTSEGGVVKYRATCLGASTASRLRTRLAINLSYATYRRSQEMMDIRSGGAHIHLSHTNAVLDMTFGMV